MSISYFEIMDLIAKSIELIAKSPFRCICINLE